MEPKSVFLNIQGGTARNRIISFLIIHQEYDYSMRDIARYAKVSYSALKLIWKDLLALGYIVNTRKVGRAKMYRLDIKNPIVKSYIDFYWAIVESVVRQSPEFRKKVGGSAEGPQNKRAASGTSMLTP